MPNAPWLETRLDTNFPLVREQKIAVPVSVTYRFLQSKVTHWNRTQRVRVTVWVYEDDQERKNLQEKKWGGMWFSETGVF